MNRLFIILAFISFKIYAQPGGGGGLRINAFYNENLDTIDIDDPSITIRKFVLADSTFNSRIVHELYPFHATGIKSHLRPYFYLPPNYANYRADIYFNLPSQRILLIKGIDSMMVDFHNIPPENGAGNIARMDSIVFMPGHFSYTKYGKEYMEYTPSKRTKVLDLVRQGLTPSTQDNLKAFNLITYSPKIDVSFLEKGNLTSTFYLRRGAYFDKTESLNSNIRDIKEAQKMGLSPREYEESLMLLTDAYTKKRKYRKAIIFISKLLEIRLEEGYHSNENDLDRIKYAYKDRIRLSIKAKDLEKAKIDYDSLVSISRLKYRYEKGKGYVLMKRSKYFVLKENIERAIFKIQYLKDYAGAIDDLMERILNIPADHLEGKPYMRSAYNETYFILGLAQFHQGHLEKAFNNWLKAMEFGYKRTGRNYALHHFDTIIPKYNTIPELYLSSAIANYNLANSGQKKEIRETYVQKSLSDLNKVEELGFSDFRVFLYKSRALQFLKLYDKALEQINMAIHKNPNDPRVYYQRYLIRNKMDLIPYDKLRNDSDWIEFERLSKEWVFPK